MEKDAIAILASFSICFMHFSFISVWLLRFAVHGAFGRAKFQSNSAWYPLKHTDFPHQTPAAELFSINFVCFLSFFPFSCLLFDYCVLCSVCGGAGQVWQQKLQTCQNPPWRLAIIIDIWRWCADWGPFGSNLLLPQRQSRIPHPFLCHRWREPCVPGGWECHVPQEFVQLLHGALSTKQCFPTALSRTIHKNADRMNQQTGVPPLRPLVCWQGGLQLLENGVPAMDAKAGRPPWLS